MYDQGFRAAALAVYQHFRNMKTAATVLKVGVGTIHRWVTNGTSTLPAYLYTHVRDTELRTKLEAYVRCYSRLFARGSYVANLAAIHSLPADLPQRMEQVVGLPTAALCDPPALLEDENQVKKCFLPERWQPELRPAAVQEVLDRHGALLQPQLPEYSALMANTGWDNALNHMGTSYLGHVKVQVCTHLARRLRAFLKSEKHAVQPGTERATYAWTLFNGLRRPCETLHKVSKTLHKVNETLC
ncbi:hypothetical protein V8C86DRAFT_3022345 [Haematococcus lacustris]